MEGGRKRRKLQNIEEDDDEEEDDEEEEDEDEDEDEEEKMKLFFALIQNTKAMRDKIKSKESAEEDNPTKGVWNPKFQPEDFIEDGFDTHRSKSKVAIELGAASSSATKQSNQKEEHQEHQEHQEQLEQPKKGLDLNLSL